MIAVDAVGAAPAGIDDQPVVEGQVAYQGVHLPGRWEWFLRFPVPNEFHPGEEADSPHIAHHLMTVENLKFIQ